MTNREAPTAPVVPGTLYLVALPIGNIGDITYRAVEILRSVSVIAAEDTRDFRRLRRAYAIDRPTLSYHDFNEQSRAPELVQRLLAGESVALVSDAGTPLVSDPGYRVVVAAIEAGLTVTSVPGPSAAIVALSACGLPVHTFQFLGFPPRTSGQRLRFFESVRDSAATLIVYEAPHRLAATLADAHAAFGDRRACLARNLTKPHERYQRGTLAELAAALAAEGEPRGEATLVIEGAQPAETNADRLAGATEEARRLLADGAEARTIVACLVADFGLKRREAYELVLRLRDGQ